MDRVLRLGDHAKFASDTHRFFRRRQMATLGDLHSLRAFDDTVFLVCFGVVRTARQYAPFGHPIFVRNEATRGCNRAVRNLSSCKCRFLSFPLLNKRRPIPMKIDNTNRAIANFQLLRAGFVVLMVARRADGRSVVRRM